MIGVLCIPAVLVHFNMAAPIGSERRVHQDVETDPGGSIAQFMGHFARYNDIQM